MSGGRKERGGSLELFPIHLHVFIQNALRCLPEWSLALVHPPLLSSPPLPTEGNQTGLAGASQVRSQGSGCGLVQSSSKRSRRHAQDTQLMSCWADRYSEIRRKTKIKADAAQRILTTKQKKYYSSRREKIMLMCRPDISSF